MKKIVLTFGLVSGVMLSAMLLATLPFLDRMGLGTSQVLGYTTMLAAGMLIYFGMRRYRDTVAAGTVTFKRLFGVGMLIWAVSAACYTATWEAVFYGVPGFGEKFVASYQARQLAAERAKGTPPAEIERKQAEMAEQWRAYQNPAINVAITFVESLPVGLLVSLVSAATLRRRGARPAVEVRQGYAT